MNPGRTGPMERALDVRGTPTLVREAGEGPAILFLHGPEEPGWPPALARLAREFRVVAPDHPGMGRTPLGAELDRIDDLVYHYLDLIEALGLGEVALVGASFGGWVAAELAVVGSPHLGKLVLADAAGLRVNRDLPEIFLMTDNQIAEFLVADSGNARLVYPLTDDPEVVERRLIQRATLARFTWEPYWHNPKLPGRLHRIRVPTLIVWGAEDRFIPPGHGTAFAERIPGAASRVIHGAGHLPHLEQPDRFSEAIAGFVRP